eukprot:5686248-Pleurochrysis_carterae.AAC.1
MPCRRALRQRDGHHESVAADLGGGSWYCGMRDATARRGPWQSAQAKGRCRSCRMGVEVLPALW